MGVPLTAGRKWACVQFARAVLGGALIFYSANPFVFLGLGAASVWRAEISRNANGLKPLWGWFCRLISILAWLRVPKS